MDLISSTPRVHTRRKSRWAPSDVDASIAAAMVGARYCSSPMVALHDGEAIGVVVSEPRGRWSDFVPLTSRQWNSISASAYSDIRTAFSQGHGCRAYFRLEMVNWTLNDAWVDAWPATGVGHTGAGTYTGAANTARQLDNTSPGCLWMSTKPGLSESTYLVGWEISNGGTNLARYLILYDRVLTYESVAISNVITNFTNTLAAQRYISAGDPGLMVSPTVQTATGATASNVTSLVFTDDQGNAGVSQVASLPQSIITSSLAPSATAGTEVVWPSFASRVPSPWIVLGGSAQGARKLESITCSAANTGTLCLALIRPIATLWLNGAVTTNFLDLTKAMFTLTKVFSTACLSFLMTQSGSNGGAFQGELSFVHK